jgi:osmotically-inducible protein OsmY
VAYLRGTVDSIFMRKEAIKTAARVPGVFEIQNELTRMIRRPIISDNEIKTSIRNQLRLNPFVDADAVTISVKLGITTLSGLVSDWRAFRAAENSARKGGALVLRNRLWIEIS